MVTSRASSHPLTGGLVTKMSRAALMCCTALALALSVGAAHAGPEIPWQFHGRWCSQEHKYGTDTLIFGRQGSVADCNMEISRHALVAGGSQFTVQCEPLEIILRRDYRYQYKGKCSLFDKTAKKDLGAPSIVEGTAWITASNLLVIKSKPKPESKEEEPKETAPAAKPEPTAREHAQHAAIFAEVAEFCPPFIKVKVPAVPALEQHHITRGRKLSTNFDQIMREEVERTRLMIEQSGGHENVCRAVIDLWPGLVSPRRETPAAPTVRPTRPRPLAFTKPPLNRLYTAGPVKVLADIDPAADGGFWAYAQMPRFPGDRCVIHITPLGTVAPLDDGQPAVLDAGSYEELLRHEMAHCHGYTHPVGADGRSDHSRWIAPEDRRL